MTRDEIENLIEQLDSPVDWAHFAGDDYALDYQELQQEAATALRSLLNPWRPIDEKAKDGNPYLFKCDFGAFGVPPEYIVLTWEGNGWWDWDCKQLHESVPDMYCPIPAEGRSKDVPDTASHEPNRSALPDLIGAAEGLGALPNGYCFCFGHGRDASKPDEDHTGECRDLRSALQKAKGGE